MSEKNGLGKLQAEVNRAALMEHTKRIRALELRLLGLEELIENLKETLKEEVRTNTETLQKLVERLEAVLMHVRIAKEI